MARVCQMDEAGWPHLGNEIQHGLAAGDVETAPGEVMPIVPSPRGQGDPGRNHRRLGHRGAQGRQKMAADEPEPTSDTRILCSSSCPTRLPRSLNSEAGGRLMALQIRISTISQIISSSEMVACQPSFSVALAGLPQQNVTSAGRRRRDR